MLAPGDVAEVVVPRGPMGLCVPCHAGARWPNGPARLGLAFAFTPVCLCVVRRAAFNTGQLVSVEVLEL